MQLSGDRRRQRERRILDSARALIAERGFEAVTMRDLARASGVSVPTLYSLFRSKHTLLFTAIVNRFAEMVAQRGPVVERGLARLLRVLDVVGREVAGVPDYARALVETFLAREDARELRRTLSEAFTLELAQGLDEMRAAGELALWVEPRTLAERIQSHAELTTLAWASGVLGSDAYGSAVQYGLCLLLIGVARGGARIALERRVSAAQPAAPRLPPERSAPTPT